MSFFRSILVAAGVLAAALVPATAESNVGGRQVNVMVFSDDADEDTIPRDNRIFNRVFARIQESLNLRGYQVFDETATSQNFTEVHKVRRIDAEFIEIARSVQPTINVAVIFQIYASVVRGEYAALQRPKVRIAGRMLNVRSGQFIGAFEVKEFPLEPLPRSCDDRECLLEHIGDYAGDLGNALGETLADKLTGFVQPSDSQANSVVAAPVVAGPVAVTAPAPTGTRPAEGCVGMEQDNFVLRFKEFEDSQINAFESLLANFGCYQHHSTLRSQRGLIEFMYVTSSGDARLSRNLRLLLDYVQTNGNVAKTGNVFEITQVRTR